MVGTYQTVGGVTTFVQFLRRDDIDAYLANVAQYEEDIAAAGGRPLDHATGRRNVIQLAIAATTWALRALSLI